MVYINQQSKENRTKLETMKNSEYAKKLDDLPLDTLERKVIDMIFRPGDRRYNYSMIADEIGYSVSWINKLVSRVLKML